VVGCRRCSCAFTPGRRASTASPAADPFDGPEATAQGRPILRLPRKAGSAAARFCRSTPLEAGGVGPHFVINALPGTGGRTGTFHIINRGPNSPMRPETKFAQSGFSLIEQSMSPKVNRSERKGIVKTSPSSAPPAKRPVRGRYNLGKKGLRAGRDHTVPRWSRTRNRPTGLKICRRNPIDLQRKPRRSEHPNPNLGAFSAFLRKIRIIPRSTIVPRVGRHCARLHSPARGGTAAMAPHTDEDPTSRPRRPRGEVPFVNFGFTHPPARPLRERACR